jgi:hypothetical protein
MKYFKKFQGQIKSGTPIALLKYNVGSGRRKRKWKEGKCMRESVLTTGAAIRFRLRDVVCPETEDVLRNLTDRLEVTGRVLYLSDSGTLLNHYAVVEVNGLATPVIVPSASVNLNKTQVKESIY